MIRTRDLISDVDREYGPELYEVWKFGNRLQPISLEGVPQISDRAKRVIDRQGRVTRTMKRVMSQTIERAKSEIFRRHLERQEAAYRESEAAL